MPAQYQRTYGKCKVEVMVEGCSVCGTNGSSAWHVKREVPAQIDGKPFILSIWVCANCVTTQTSYQVPLPLIGASDAEA